MPLTQNHNSIYMVAEKIKLNYVKLLMTHLDIWDSVFVFVH